ncbi:hypothetical protein HYE43_00855 [Mycoplasmopsis bovis]|nr:hypothetical protein [Mycoplasmopsis bovis]QQH20136.1 hypothetical protein HYE43_00855 [Mycoplasmopsis bovis]
MRTKKKETRSGQDQISTPANLNQGTPTTQGQGTPTNGIKVHKPGQGTQQGQRYTN